MYVTHIIDMCSTSQNRHWFRHEISTDDVFVSFVKSYSFQTNFDLMQETEPTVKSGSSLCETTVIFMILDLTLLLRCYRQVVV